MKQIRTFQFRLPKGTHDDVLDTWGVLAGRVIRYIHVKLSDITLKAAYLSDDGNAEFLRTAQNTLKTHTLLRFGITGRQYNGLLQQLTGLWHSRREMAKLDVERLQ